MLTPGGDLIDAARDRMNAIQRYTGLGSGFRLAMRDLEMRGAGNLLGANQSGHISNVGFDLYCQLLRRTIAQMQGKTPPPLMDVAVRIDFLNLSPHLATSKTALLFRMNMSKMKTYAFVFTNEYLPSPKKDHAHQKEIKDRFGPCLHPFNASY